MFEFAHKAELQHEVAEGIESRESKLTRAISAATTPCVPMCALHAIRVKIPHRVRGLCAISPQFCKNGSWYPQCLRKKVKSVDMAEADKIKSIHNCYH